MPANSQHSITHIGIAGHDPLLCATLIKALQQALNSPLQFSVFAADCGHNTFKTSYDLVLLIGASFTASETPQNALLLLRSRLEQLGTPYSVLYGSYAEMLGSAQSTIHHALNKVAYTTTAQRPWNWSCEKCSDAVCEHRLFSTLLKQDSVRV